MINLQKIAGKMMGQLEAFDGSRAALDANQILIVRGRSQKRINPDKMEAELDELLTFMDAAEIDMLSDEAASLINRMDEQIRAEVEISGDTDAGGIENLKESLESMNFHVAYKIAMLDKAGFFAVIWKDGSGIGPCFVELVISSAPE